MEIMVDETHDARNERIQKMAKSVENAIAEPTAEAWAKEIGEKLNLGMEQDISKILAESEAVGVKENAEEIAGEICGSILSVYKETAESGDEEYFKGSERQMSDKFAASGVQKVLEAHGIFLPKYPDESGEREKLFFTIQQVSDEISEFIKTNTYENFLRNQGVGTRQEIGLAGNEMAERLNRRAEADYADPIETAEAWHNGTDEGMDTTVHAAERNPFLAADPERIQELQEQAEAVEKMQQEAASNVEFDKDGNPHYPKNEAAEENAHPILEESREYWKDKFVNDNSETFKMLDDFLNNGIRPKNDEFIFPAIPDILKFAGVSENEIVIKTSVINKARHEHSLSTKEIREAIGDIASPVLVFASDKNSTENKKDSYLSLTDTFAENGKPIAFAMNLDSDYERKNRILQVNEIRSIHDRTLIAKNETDLIQKWTADGLCRYVDDKKISEWSKAAGVQFPLAVLQSDNNSISTKSEFDKQFDGKKISDWQLAAGVQSPLAVLQPDNNTIPAKSGFVKQPDGIILGKTEVPEFAMITQNGFKTFSGMTVTEHDAAANSWTLSNENGERIVLKDKILKELTSKEIAERAKKFTENTSAIGKTLEAQYDDFFRQRENTANNFRHNLSVYCRKEANSPLDALKVANALVKDMSTEERRKTKELLKALGKDGENVNEVIVRTYLEAVKETPLNEEHLKRGRYDKIIARPMYDTVSGRGEKIDDSFDLKIGDTVNGIAFKTDRTFGIGKDKIFQDCKIVSASKENNMVTLMDGDKSFYDVPRDTFLKEYAKREKYEKKQEIKEARKKNIMRLDIER